MKNVLVVYYSQTGQLKEVLDQIVSEFSETISVTYAEIKPQEEFPFPWRLEEFYGVFPETFKQVPIPLMPISKEVSDKKYDLVLLGYTVWFLTPSLPINAFLKSDAGKKILAHTPVVTVSATRNMWIMAQEKMKLLLEDAQAQLVGNIALVDKNVNHISVITIVHWLMGGKKTKLWGIFPKPGVSDKDISASKRFGSTIQSALEKNSYTDLQDALLEQGAVKVNPSLIATDIRGNMVFTKWSNFLINRKGEKRRKGLVFFKYYLLFAIWFIAPIVFIVFLLTYFPSYRKIQRDKKYYSSVVLKKR